MMPAYEVGDFVPPAPVARAVVRGPAGEVRADVSFLIDTGADLSVVPRRVAEEVGAGIHPSDIRIRSYDGSEMTCEVADVTVEFLRFRFRGIFVVADSESGLLGRNILNLLVVTLDGPRQFWFA